MEYKGKTRQYRMFSVCLFLCAFLFMDIALLKSQTKAGEKSLQDLIDGSTGATTIDLQGKTYTMVSLFFDDKKNITLTNGRLIQYHNSNNGSFLNLRPGSSLTLKNITITGANYPIKATFINIEENASLAIHEGTRIEKFITDGSVGASCIVVYAGGSLNMAGGEIYGNTGTCGQIWIKKGASFEMTGGSFSTIYVDDDIRFGGEALINTYLSDNESCRILVVSALQNDILVNKSGKIGTVIASGVDGYKLTRSDLAKFNFYSSKGEYGLALDDNNIVLVDPDAAPPIETEDDLSEKIDELPAGTEESPSEVVVEQEIPLTKPVGVNDKYIDLGGGGTLISQNSDAGIIINKGGLTLNDIVIRGEWTNASTLLDVKNGGYLKIGLATEIVSISDYLRTILIDKLSSVVSEGKITGHISNTGSLFVKDGSIEGQISSFSPFKFSGKVAVKNGIYLGRGNGTNGLINLVDPLRSSLNILVDEKMIADATSSVLIAQGTDGYMPTESDLDKLVCFTDDCEFYLHGYQILMRKIDHTANEQINRKSLQLRTSGRDIHVEGVPAGQPYGLYDLSGTLLSGGVSDGGTISLSVSHPGIYIFHVAGIGKKVQISR
ncbi:hypothetical protein [uncultured Parabacteroides sp.]|uniref:hypothetical protein n=1 Tax=uncultured Parabacteroides sp. TaxID=512312 RepID=UPI0025FD7FB4|nr:hypothetical protein [uncultured Parabacteroides sp.]